MKKLKFSDILALGFMTFALFVGAGNIILPPFIGLHAGHNVWYAAIGFLITGVSLPVITIVAMARVGGAMSTLTQPIGKVAGTLLAVICYLSIGPLFAGPRTATVSFEVGVFPFLKEANWLDYEPYALFAYSFIYFIIVIGVSFYPAKLLNSVGRVLAPLKILALAILGVAAFLYPVGDVVPPTNAYETGAFTQGFINGYLTMDTLASLAFGLVIINAIRSRGIESNKLISRYAVIAGLIAGVGLTLVYICLFKLGSNSAPISMGLDNGAKVLQAYVNYTFGEFGAIFLAILIGIACLVTAIGVTTACSAYFANLLSVSYRVVVLVVATVSFVVSNIGLTQLLAISGPILVAIYPPCIALVLMSFFKNFWRNPQYVFVPVMIVSLFFGIFDGLKAADIAAPKFIASLPLAEASLAWLIPSIVVLVLATVWDMISRKMSYPKN